MVFELHITVLHEKGCQMDSTFSFEGRSIPEYRIKVPRNIKGELITTISTRCISCISVIRPTTHHTANAMGKCIAYRLYETSPNLAIALPSGPFQLILVSPWRVTIMNVNPSAQSILPTTPPPNAGPAKTAITSMTADNVPNIQRRLMGEALIAQARTIPSPNHSINPKR